MMPRKFVEQRSPSDAARCSRILETFVDRDGFTKAWYCNAEMKLRVREHDVAECCTFGHIRRSQAVVREQEA